MNHRSAGRTRRLAALLTLAFWLVPGGAWAWPPFGRQGVVFLDASRFAPNATEAFVTAYDLASGVAHEVEVGAALANLQHFHWLGFRGNRSVYNLLDELAPVHRDVYDI